MPKTAQFSASAGGIRNPAAVNASATAAVRMACFAFMLCSLPCCHGIQSLRVLHPAMSRSSLRSLCSSCLDKRRLFSHSLACNGTVAHGSGCDLDSEPVEAVPALVIHLRGQLADQVYSHTSGCPIFERNVELGLRCLERIELMTIILEFDQEPIRFNPYAKQDVVRRVVVVTVFKDIGRHFLDRQVRKIESPGTHTPLFEKSQGCFDDAKEFGKLVDELRFKHIIGGRDHTARNLARSGLQCRVQNQDKNERHERLD
jgi:hypothetical protein